VGSKSPSATIESQVDSLVDQFPQNTDAAIPRTVPLAIQRMPQRVRAVLHEPLVHFLALGAVIFVVSSVLDRSSPLGAGQHTIHVSSARLQQMKETWAARWGTSPDSGQLQALVDDFVREEVLYREAIASGLDKDDTIIRRHLAQKVEFLAHGASAADEPTDAQLQHYFDQHRDRYGDPAKVSFSHVYFNVERRGASATSAATELLARLRAGGAFAVVGTLGDAFMLQSEYPPQSHDEIRDLFGAEFADRLFELPAGEWRGPIASSYGLHLVRIADAVPSRIPSLEAVRSRVKLDFAEQRDTMAVDAYYQSLRQRYQVVVDQQEPAAP
jgi:peptidyl-prolyl cis-trans isomerase C